MSFPVHAITLDLDDTIWPIGPVIGRAETALGAWLRENAPRTAERWPLAAMRALRDEVAAEHPQLAPVPASRVFYAPSVSANLFSYNREFFVFLGGVWYVGPGHNGPWAELPPQYVPRPILAVPVRYYRERPREWAHWRHEAPPRWAPAWGHRWEERRAERHQAYRDEHRGDRHKGYRDDRR